jgi:apolipoprotein N-acyltransferase
LARRAPSLPTLLHALAALAAGGLQAAAIAAPGSGRPLWWLQLLSLAALAGLLRRQPSWRGAAWLGGGFAVAWLAGTWWWLFVSMHVYGGLAAPLAVAAVLALASFLGSYYAAAAGLAWRLGQGGTLRGALAFAGAWLLAELARGRWFTGFPWGAGGYAHVEGPLAALAPWVGVYGIGFFASLVAALIASAVAAPAADRAHRSWRSRALVQAVVVASLVAAHRLPAGDIRPAGEPLSVALLQGNIPQDEKFQSGTGVPLALDWYARELRASTASLVVAPETAIPLLPAQLPAGYLDRIDEQFRGGNGTQAALLGIPLGSYQEGYTNSVVGLAPRTGMYRYDKHHLVPFGEFIPPFFRWFTALMNIPLGDFNRGGVGQPSLEWRSQRLAPNICYEDLFGEELAARFADPARAPTAFVNLSNIGWFGDTVAIDQHLSISRMRALEFARPVIRATNTGATAIIDHHAVVTHVLPRHTRGVLVGQVQGQQGLTPFARWSAAWGLWPLWGLGIACILAAFLLGRRAARP